MSGGRGADCALAAGVAGVGGVTGAAGVSRAGGTDGEAGLGATVVAGWGAGWGAGGGGVFAGCADAEDCTVAEGESGGSVDVDAGRCTDTGGCADADAGDRTTPAGAGGGVTTACGSFTADCCGCDCCCGCGVGFAGSAAETDGFADAGVSDADVACSDGDFNPPTAALAAATAAAAAAAVAEAMPPAKVDAGADGGVLETIGVEVCVDADAAGAGGVDCPTAGLAGCVADGEGTGVTGGTDT